MKPPKPTFKNQAKINVIVQLGLVALGLLALAIAYLIR